MGEGIPMNFGLCFHHHLEFHNFCNWKIPMKPRWNYALCVFFIIRGLLGEVHLICHFAQLLFMAEILHQLRLVVYPIIYWVLYIPRWWRISSINSMIRFSLACLLISPLSRLFNLENARRGLQLNSFCKIGYTIQKKLGHGKQQPRCEI